VNFLKKSRNSYFPNKFGISKKDPEKLLNLPKKKDGKTSPFLNLLPKNT
jgi:hypothetical protein